MPKLKRSTLAAQALGWRDSITGSLVPPLVASVPYERAADGSYTAGRSYTRDQNPTYDQAEALLAELEGGAGAMLFSSGMAAATTVFEALESGSHVVAQRNMYWTIRRWLEELAADDRISLDLVPNGDMTCLKSVIRPGETKIVWIETPANPMCDITDIAASAEIAHAGGARVVVDSTLATPVLSQPLEWGADMVMHSATKQLNGHSDVLAGALVTKVEDNFWTRIGHDRVSRGAVMGPFEAWLLLRGMRTLFLRVPAAARSALRVAELLTQHSSVVEVMYPGLTGHPGHAIAAAQMQDGYGTILSFRPIGGEVAAKRVVGALKVFRNATSLGGVESLVEHRAPVEGPDTNVPNDLIRLSFGIEDETDLILDLEQALETVESG